MKHGSAAAGGTWSLRKRLLALVLSLTVCAWIAGSVVAFRAAQEVDARMRDQQLEQLASAVLAFWRHELAEVAVGAPSPPVTPDGRAGLDLRHRWQVWRGAQVQAHSPDAPASAPLAGTHEPGLRDTLVDGLRARTYVGRPDPQGLQIQVSEVLGDDPVGTPWPGAGVAATMLLSLAAVGAAAMALVMRALRPVDAAARALRERLPHELDPVSADELPDEMRPLIDALNSHLLRTAERLSRERGFTALAAHELRTPLAALRMQVQVVLRSSDEAARRVRLEALMASVDRCDHLIDQLLTLARIEQDHGGTRLTVELGALARSVIDDLGAAQRVHAPSVSVRGAPAAVTGWPFGLAVLLRNLIDNALVHAPPGTAVEVVLARHDGQVELCVDDAGPGIPVADRPRVFERFVRLEGGRAPGGVGLGLAIVRAVADAHGATVELTDSPLGGLRVRVSFSAASGPAGSPGPGP